MSLQYTERPGLSAGDWFMLILLLGLAGGLRAAGWDQTGVIHFDEGVYASNRFFDEGAYPDRHLYAPPLFPAIVEWSSYLGGIFDAEQAAPLVVNVVFGVLTVLLSWWAGRKWFGRSAGWVSGLLVAVSDPHLFFSRSVLTDVSLAFWLLAAVHAGWEALRRSSLGWAVVAGLLAGLAWATKYNGWLALAIIASGSLAAWIEKKLLRQQSPLTLMSLLKTWLLMALGAAALVYFVWADLQSVGGYQVVAENHARYFVGWPGWVDSLVQHWQKQQVINSMPGCFGLAVAALLAVLLVIRRGEGAREKPDNLIRWGMVSLSSVLFLLGTGSVAGVVASLAGLTLLAALAFLLRFRRLRKQPDSYAADSRLAGWLLLAWFVGLTLATPLYYPYPRLIVPWLVAACLGVGWLAQAIRERVQLAIMQTDTGVLNPPSMLTTLLAGCLALGGVALFWQHLKTTTEQMSYPAWENRSEFSFMSRRIIATCARDTKTDFQDMADNTPFVIYVYGEPALFYHLRGNYPAVAAIGRLDFEPHGKPTYVIIGPHQQELWQNFGETVAGYEDKLERVEQFRFQEPNLVKLDKPVGSDPVPPPEPEFDPENPDAEPELYPNFEYDEDGNLLLGEKMILYKVLK